MINYIEMNNNTGKKAFKTANNWLEASLPWVMTPKTNSRDKNCNSDTKVWCLK